MTSGVKLIVGGVAFFIILIIVIAIFPVVIVGAGERGVVMKYGKVQDQILGEGMHFRTPFQDDVKTISVKTRTTKITGVAGSSDSQVVTFTAQVNWRMNPNTVNKTYQSVGDENAVETNYIVTKGPDAIKESVSKSTAIDFQKNRETVRKLAIDNLRERMGSAALIEDISFTDIDFSKDFNAAIEAKVTAEQNALAEKNKLETVKYQAQQRVEQANAEATAIKIQTEALSQNQNLIELKKAERWDGHLPTTIVGGGTIPFFNLNP